MNCFNNTNTWIWNKGEILHKGMVCQCGQQRWLQNEEPNFSVDYNAGTVGSKPIYRLRQMTFEKIRYRQT